MHYHLLTRSCIRPHNRRKLDYISGKLSEAVLLLSKGDLRMNKGYLGWIDASSAKMLFRGRYINALTGSCLLEDYGRRADLQRREFSQLIDTVIEIFMRTLSSYFDLAVASLFRRYRSQGHILPISTTPSWHQR